MSYIIKECITEGDIASALPLLSHLYNRPESDFPPLIKEMMEHDYRLIAAFDGEKCCGAVGFRTGYRLYCGRYTHIDNMVVHEDYRQHSVGKQLIGWIKGEAKKLGCDTVLADTYVSNHGAQTFFIKQGFFIRGLHLKHDLKD